MTDHHCSGCRDAAPDRLPGRPDITTPEQLREVMRLDFTFSDQQFTAITAPLEPGVIVAGAGSGKTAVMAARVVWLVATGRVAPGEVLGLTFTTKAAAELRERVTVSLQRAGCLPDPSLPPGPAAVDEAEPVISTYHAYAGALLTENGLRIGHEPDTRIMADAARFQVAARAVAAYDQPCQHVSTSVSRATDDLVALDAELSEHLVSPERLRDFDRRLRRRLVEEQSVSRATTHYDDLLVTTDKRQELLSLVESYRAFKKRLGVMDFSDQIALTAQLVDEHPQVAATQRQAYKVVLLDEYQDTSVAQAALLQSLFSGTDADGGRGVSVTAVGDPNQAIYGWRGASASNIAHFATQFPRACGAASSRYSLTVNRRSHRRILDAADAVADELYQKMPEVEHLETPPGTPDGEVRVALHETYVDELASLVDQVKERAGQLHAGGVHVDGRPPWSEIAVLAKTNDHLADAYDVLTRADVPVEIVGLGGLLRLPEVDQVVATLSVVEDVTANAALLTLLTGPRWQIGPRDLALLGRRARELAHGGRPHGRDEEPLSIGDELTGAVTGADVADVESLGDALDDPGRHGYSPQARARFAALSRELSLLREVASEPLLDLVRRVIDLSGLEVELSAAVDPHVRDRRDSIDQFVAAVAEFVSIDGEATLAALMSFLRAEIDQGVGLQAAAPTAANSVKLLTMHRAKGLEWDTVHILGVSTGKFPKRDARSTWVTAARVLPYPLRGDRSDLPQVSDWSRKGVQAFKNDARDLHHDEERRLAYVALTRAKHRLVVSAFWWFPTSQGLNGPSDYLTRTAHLVDAWGETPLEWAARPEAADGQGTPVNPLKLEVTSRPWPGHPGPEGTWPADSEIGRRRRGAELVSEARRRIGEGAHVTPASDIADREAAALFEQWDREAALLVDEARASRADVVEVPLPASLSATSLAALRDDPDGFAAALARPMPRRPSPAARFGTRFHAWVESRFGQQELLDPLDLPGRADSDISDESDLAGLIEAFEAGPFADRVPSHVEPPFALSIGGQVIRGRIDAVFDEHDGSALIVDWKTNRRQTADPWQLAVYRAAWAELTGLPLTRVRAAFYYVRTGDLVEPDELPGPQELEAFLAGR